MCIYIYTYTSVKSDAYDIILLYCYRKMVP